MRESNYQFREKMEKLKKHESKIDVSREWGALEKRMDKKKRRKVFFIFSSLGLALMVGLSYLYIEYALDETGTPHQEYSVHTEENDPSAVANHTFPNINSKNTFLHPDKVKEIRSHRQPIIMGNEKEPIFQKDKKIEIKEHNSKKVENGGIYQKNVLRPNEISEPFNVDRASNQSDFYSDDILSEPKAFDNSKNDELSKISQLTASPIQTLQNANVESQTERSINFGATITPIPLTQNMMPFFIDLRTSLGFANKKYIFDKADETTDYLIHKSNYQSLETVSGHIAIGKELHHKFFVQFGLRYQKNHERWQNFRIDTQAVNIDNQIIGQYIDHRGNLSQFTGTKNGLELAKTTHTRYLSTEIYSGTLSLGRYIYIKKFRWALEATVAFPLTTIYQGHMLDASGHQVTLDEVYQPIKTIQYGMHTSCIYPITKNMAVYGGYDYNFLKQNSSMGFKRLQDIHSLSVGMKYFLNYKIF